MQVIRLREPFFAAEPESDIKHLPVEFCERLFGWDSVCQSVEIFLKEEIPDVEFYAVAAFGEEGITLAAEGELGRHHYFVPWTNIVAVHGHIAT